MADFVVMIIYICSIGHSIAVKRITTMVCRDNDNVIDSSVSFSTDPNSHDNTIMQITLDQPHQKIQPFFCFCFGAFQQQSWYPVWHWFLVCIGQMFSAVAAQIVLGMTCAFGSHYTHHDPHHAQGMRCSKQLVYCLHLHSRCCLLPLEFQQTWKWHSSVVWLVCFFNCLGGAWNLYLDRITVDTTASNQSNTHCGWWGYFGCFQCHHWWTHHGSNILWHITKQHLSIDCSGNLLGCCGICH